MKPTIGRIVHYRLSDADVAAINAGRDTIAVQKHRNPVSAGQVYPATITAVFDEASGTANLVVQLDGTQQHWVTSRKRGEPADGHEPSGGTIPPGTWCWPPRV
ncbi:hypothetical protein [Micromonospora sp. HUAS LYJ1]|uniref:hypothetical protein n=1 Tax=Micromonospora sp. HUAS LYJ1 TaxID=3061626 RepID=UPI0026725AC7|nr:hypothetical protein [Micromonospora sp. HUAS LYJ1]WKU03743.1 hypothetical protein Q2K16_23305 [Micromonospora sp. HUAS LYJ1]